MKTENILIVRHGALGDLVQSTGPIRAIREHHPKARITLLTTPQFANFMDCCPWIDEVWQDYRPKWFQIIDWIHLRRKLCEGAFARVYDLQTSFRSSFYIYAFYKNSRPEWSGIASGASHFHANSHRDFMHTLDRQSEQLKIAGINDIPDPDLSWVRADVGQFRLLQTYALVVPGGSAHRPAKRWPAEYYLDLCQRFLTASIQPVLIGSRDEISLNAGIAAKCPGALDLTNQTTIEELVVLARSAKLSIGNDTGPVHVAAVAGHPTVVLYSQESDPHLCAPRGQNVTIIREEKLVDLTVDCVWRQMP